MIPDRPDRVCLKNYWSKDFCTMVFDGSSNANPQRSSESEEDINMHISARAHLLLIQLLRHLGY